MLCSKYSSFANVLECFLRCMLVVRENVTAAATNTIVCYLYGLCGLTCNLTADTAQTGAG
jgi:hypothetical protein